MPANQYTPPSVPIIGFVARSGTGKTTLLSQLIPLLNKQGLRVAVIKHTHHDFEIDKPGKDSYVLRKAGAQQTLLASKQRTALVREHVPPRNEVRLQDCVAQLDLKQLDLILVEGFKNESYPKIEVQRTALQHTPLFLDDSDIIAVASDNPAPAQCPLQVLDSNNLQQICDFILQFINNPD